VYREVQPRVTSFCLNSQLANQWSASIAESVAALTLIISAQAYLHQLLHGLHVRITLERRNLITNVFVNFIGNIWIPLFPANHVC
jgi:hypothetical protein